MLYGSSGGNCLRYVKYVKIYNIIQGGRPGALGGASWWNQSRTGCVPMFNLHAMEWVEDIVQDDMQLGQQPPR